MSLYKDASLVMIPSAYKDGKLYSIRPTDGSGDFTFSRGSNLAATRVDVNGLIEKGRENLLTYSDDFSDSSWVKIGSSVTSGQAGYDGTNNAYSLTPNTATQQHYLYKAGNAGNELTTTSFYVKYSGYHAQLRVFNIGAGVSYANFDLQNGTKGTSGGSANIDSTITSVGNDWYRITMTLNYSSAYSIGISPVPTPSAGELPNYTGDGTSGIYIQDAQLEAGLVATDYIETGASTAQAGILEDMPRLDYSGGASCPALLLEPQRTNFVTDSEYFAGLNLYGSISATYGAYTNPSGNDSAYLLEATSAISRIQTLSSTGDGNSAVMSIFIKGNDNVSYPTLANQGGGQYTRWEFDANNVLTYYDGDAPSGDYGQEDYGNGWYRIWLKTDTINGSTNYYRFNPDNRYGVGSLYAWGFQVEKNSSYPTSYIPTYGSSVTRSNDYKQLDNLISLGLVSNDTFTYFAELNCENIIRDSSSPAIEIGSNPQRILFYNSSSSAARRFEIFIQDGTTQTYTLTADVSKICISVQPNLIKVYENGVNVLTTTQNLDLTSNSNYRMYGNNRAFSLKQDVFFPTALTDSECIALTTL